MLDALSWTRVPVTFADWYYVPQLDEWQFVIATPWYDSKGPLAVWSALVAALQQAGIYEQVPTRRVFVKSPNDSLVKSLENEARQQSRGFLHILREGAPGRQGQYSVIFAPITGHGGPVPAKRFSVETELESFLTNRIHLRQSAVSDALVELKRQGHSSIFPVQLSLLELKKAGLPQS